MTTRGQIATVMIVNAVDSAGDLMDTSPDCMAQTIAYNGDGTVHTITATDGTSTYVQTMTYNGSGQLTNKSMWVKQ